MHAVTSQLVRQFAATADRRFQFQKCRQYVIRTHNEPLTISSMRVSNEDRVPTEIHG
jgi:hypothetical protein